MNKIQKFFNDTFTKQIDGTGLAIFRIAYSFILLCEIAHMFYFRHLIFDKVPYIENAEIEFGFPIGIWFISVFFVMIGWKTRMSAIINYLMTIILIGSINTYEYHIFYIYIIINFLLIFSPVNKVLSIDRALNNIYLKSNQQSLESNDVSQIYYLLIVFFGIGLVYFDSIFFKITEYSWYSGLGVWMPSSLPMMVHLKFDFFLNCKYLMYFLGYLTLIFEAAFIFIFMNKKLRLVAFIIGIGLHIGILLTFPIPFFALAVCSIYIALIPVKFWKSLEVNKIQDKIDHYVGRIVTYFNISIDYEIFNVYRKKYNKIFLTYFSIFAIVIQLTITYNSSFFYQIKKKFKIENSSVEKSISKVFNEINYLPKRLFGITKHSVFLDNIHFKGYNHIIAVTYLDESGNERWLPLIKQSGQPSYYAYGTNWRKFSFDTNSPSINNKKLNNGIRDFTAFWAHKNNIDLNNATFNIKVKKIDLPKQWEKNFINIQMAQPWVDGGYIKWENYEYNSFIKDIESI